MRKFPESFSEDIGSYTKAKATFKIKENLMLIFKPKRKVLFTAKAFISKGLDRFEQIGALTKIDNSEWTSPTVYVKNKMKLGPTQIFLRDWTIVWKHTITLGQVRKTYLRN